MKERLILMYRLIEMLYSKEELRTLCFELGVEYDDLPSETRQAKAQELVQWMHRRGRFNELLNQVYQDRLEIFEQADPRADRFISDVRNLWLDLQATNKAINLDDIDESINLESATHLIETSLQEITEYDSALSSLVRAMSQHIEQSKAEKLSIGQQVIEEELPKLHNVGAKIKHRWSQIDRTVALHWLEFARGINDIVPRYHKAWTEYERGLTVLLQSLEGQHLTLARDSVRGYLDSLHIRWGSTLFFHTTLKEFPTDNIELGRAIQRSVQAYDELLRLIEDGIAFIMTVIQQPLAPSVNRP